MKENHIVLITVLAMIFVVVGATALFILPKAASSGPTPTSISDRLEAMGLLSKLSPGPKIGENAPAFEVTVIDGRQLKLDDVKGKPIVVYFWATWCASCVTSLNEMKKVYPQYQDKINFVGVDLDLQETPEIIQEWVVKNGVPGTFAVGNEQILKDYGVIYTSLKYSLDPQTVVLEKGSSTFYENDWKKLFDSLI